MADYDAHPSKSDRLSADCVAATFVYSLLLTHHKKDIKSVSAPVCCQVGIK